MCWALVTVVPTPEISLMSCTWWQVAGVLVARAGAATPLAAWPREAQQYSGHSLYWPKARPASRLGEVVQRVCVQFFFVVFFLIIFGCAGSLLLRGVFLAAASRGLLWLRYAGFSWGLLLLRSSGSGARELGSCGSGAPSAGSAVAAPALAALQHVGLPRPRIKHMSPALAGRVFTPELPGKACVRF